MLRSSFLRPSFAALVVAAGTAFSLAACTSEEADDDDDAGSGGVGGMTNNAGGTTSKAGSSSGGAGTGGTSSAGAGAGGTSTAGTGGTTGGTNAGGKSGGGAGGSLGGAGSGGTGTSGSGGSIGGAGAGGAGAGGTSGAGTGGALGGAGAGGAGGAGGGAGGGTGGGSMDDYEPQASDFTCIADWERPMGPNGAVGFRITNVLGHTAEALAVAENPDGGVYPVGTIIQHLPTEAMAKRGPGFSAETKDWEFFQLTLSAQGATITARGATNVMTMGNTCASCHSTADDSMDFICNTSKDYASTACDGGFDFPISMLESQENSAANCR